jgi:hypothetical protein
VALLFSHTVKKIISVFIFVCLAVQMDAQALVKDSCITFSFLGIGAGIHVPSGDMAKRFGNDAAVQGVFAIKNKHNYTLSAQSAFIFGNKIYEQNVLDPIATQQGTVIDKDGRLAEIRFYERGYHIALSVGKIFSFKKPNPNSGIWVTLGGGFLQHKIRIENIGNTVVELSPQYLKGYDRLTNGAELHEFVGYVYFGNKRLINFFAGFESLQAFTQSRRDFDFATMSKDTKKRMDILSGFKFGWVLAFYTKPDKFYYH